MVDDDDEEDGCNVDMSWLTAASFSSMRWALAAEEGEEGGDDDDDEDDGRDKGSRTLRAGRNSPCGRAAAERMSLVLFSYKTSRRMMKRRMTSLYGRVSRKESSTLL